MKRKIKRILFLVVTLLLIPIFFLVAYVWYFTSVSYYEQYGHWGATESQVSLEGLIIANPNYAGYQRGTETYCWDNQLVPHLFELSDRTPDPNRLPTYLDEIWNSFSYIPEMQYLHGRNVLPVLLKRKPSNLWGVVRKILLSRYEGKKVKIRATLAQSTNCNSARMRGVFCNISWECRLLLVDDIAMVTSY